MSERAFYQGAALQLVDKDKKRVAVPANLRQAVILNSPGIDPKDIRITIASHAKAECLIGYDQGWLALQHRKAATLEEQYLLKTGEEDFNFMRLAGGGGELVGLDSSGRFVLPGHLAFEANIGEQAFFYGSMNYFEIWDPATLIADPDAPPQMKKKLRYFAQEKGLSL